MPPFHRPTVRMLRARCCRKPQTLSQGFGALDVALERTLHSSSIRYRRRVSVQSAFPNKTLERVLDGLSPEDLNWQPRPDCNSIGWTAWHLIRAHDGLISSVMGQEELWLKDGWHAKFDRPPDPTDSGYGHGPEQVAAFKTDVETLLNYNRAVTERSLKYLATMSSSDLDRKIDDFLSEVCPTAGARLIITLNELLQHVGQMGYIRGLRQGKGWQEY